MPLIVFGIKSYFDVLDFHGFVLIIDLEDCLARLQQFLCVCILRLFVDTIVMIFWQLLFLAVVLFTVNFSIDCTHIFSAAPNLDAPCLVFLSLLFLFFSRLFLLFFSRIVLVIRVFYWVANLDVVNLIRFFQVNN